MPFLCVSNLFHISVQRLFHFFFLFSWDGIGAFAYFILSAALSSFCEWKGVCVWRGRGYKWDLFVVREQLWKWCGHVYVCVSDFLYHSPAALVFQYAKENKNNNEMNKRLIFKWSAVVSVVTDAEHCPSRLSACLLLVPISQLAKSRKKKKE